MFTNFSIILILQLLLTSLKQINGAFFLPGIATVDDYDSAKEIEFYTLSPRTNPSLIRNLESNAPWIPVISPIKEEDNIVEMSEDVFKKIGSFADMNELHKVLGIQPEISFDVVHTINMNTAFSEVDARAGVPETRSKNTDQYLSNPQQAHCEPELHPVDLGLTNTYTVTYYPTCVRINQCGGCCPNKDIFSCQPVTSEKVFVKVLELSTTNERTTTHPSRSRRRRNNIRVQYNTINVTVDEHKQCACLCKIKEQDCDLSFHLYDEQSCACVCMNKDEEDKCITKSSHVWKKETCQCLCRKEMACSSSEFLDHATCTCIPASTGLILDNVHSRNAQNWDQIFRRRKPTQALKLEGQLCKENELLMHGFGRCRMPNR